MERSKYIIIIFISLLAIPHNLSSQPSYRESIYKAYIIGSIPAWKAVIDDMENSDLSSVERKLELLNYYYGYTGFMIGNKMNEQAKKYIVKAEELIDQVLEFEPDNATATAYKGSFISFKIGLNKLKAVTLGPQSMKYIKRANQLDPDNVQALADMGNMLYYAPGIFGGSKKESLAYFRKAIRNMEAGNDIADNWFYLYYLTLMAQFYEEMGNTDEALLTYRKILQKEPNFRWVRDELYPALLKKLGK